MKYRNNRRYRLHDGCCVICKNQLFYLAYCDYGSEVTEYIFDYGFKDIRVMCNEALFCRNDYYNYGSIVLLLKSVDGTAGIYDFWKRKWLLENIKYTSTRKVQRYTLNLGTWLKPINIFDTIFEFVQKGENYSLINFSLQKGIILGPLNKEPTFLDFGYLIDGHIIHYFEGFEDDLNDYEKVELNEDSEHYYDIYYKKEEDRYYVFFDYDKEGGLWPLEKDDDEMDKDNPIRTVEVNCLNCIEHLEFNVETKILKVSNLSYSDGGGEDWNDWTNDAFEGYSPLELGLD